MDNINEDIKSVGLRLRGAMDLTKYRRKFEVIYSYPSPPNGWRQELMMLNSFRGKTISITRRKLEPVVSDQ